MFQWIKLHTSPDTMRNGERHSKWE